MTDVRIALLDDERPGRPGRLSDRLVPALRELGACVSVMDATSRAVCLSVPPAWDLTLLKSGSAAALHVAAAAEGWGVPCLDPTGSVRIARDRIATWTALDAAGVGLTPWRAVWIAPETWTHSRDRSLGDLADGPIVVKAARGSRGRGVWMLDAGELPVLAARVPAGPYLLMTSIPHDGPDLKVYVAGDRVDGLERCFPAETLEQKRGRPVSVPREAMAVSRRVGAVLGLTFYGCDFVHGPDGWRLVDVNAFPGYKGVDEAADAIAARVVATAERLRATGDRDAPLVHRRW